MGNESWGLHGRHPILATLLVVCTLVTILPACRPMPPPGPPVTDKVGQPVELEDVYGTFYAYVPTSLPAAPEIAVLVHGTPKEESGQETAHYYLLNWMDFAEEHGLILIAPAFSQADFSSQLGDHAMSGYRGLFGREIGADEWVLRLLRAYQQAYGVANQPFYLYGHSAGGQFVGRFVVTHPEVLKRAVITAAATYPQPTEEVAWPFGMGELHMDIEWDADTSKRVDIVPDKQTWLAGTQVPLTVMVGLNDSSVIHVYPGQKGNNRFVIGRNWVGDMALFAEENDLESKIQFEMIPAKGHSMIGLVPYSQAALLSD